MSNTEEHDEHDEHWGLGGSYERDPETGKRRLLHRTRPYPVIPPIRVVLTVDEFVIPAVKGATQNSGE